MASNKETQHSTKKAGLFQGKFFEKIKLNNTKQEWTSPNVTTLHSADEVKQAKTPSEKGSNGV